jgi:hypothetical protein
MTTRMRWDRLLGRRVTALTADTATIENNATGSSTVFRKHNDQTARSAGR